MQLTGTQFTRTAAVFGNDIATLPDFPAEIRAPAGSLAGVSGFQISFSSTDIHTPGDAPDVLVAMNPAALKTNLGDVPPRRRHHRQRGRLQRTRTWPRPATSRTRSTDGTLAGFNVFEIPISTLNVRALEGLEMSTKQMDQTKNFFALGVMFWLYERSMEPTLAWIEKKFAAKPVFAEANMRALKAGYAFGETTEIFHTHYRVKPAHLPPGTYRNITGNEATALGLRGRQPSWRSASSSTARTRSRPPATSSTSSRPTSTSACAPSRRRMRSPPSAPPSARPSAAPWA